MASSFFRSIFRHRAYHKPMPQICEEQDKMIATAIQGALKLGAHCNIADKYFGIVARSTNTAVKMKRASDVKAACDTVAAIARADAVKAQVDAAKAKANAARARAYAAGALPFGVGFLV